MDPMFTPDGPTSPADVATTSIRVSSSTGAAVRPGWRSTEFWLATAAKLLGILMASGIIGDGSALERVAGLGAAVLAAMGYGVQRAIVKTAAPLAVILAMGWVTIGLASCAEARSRAAAGAHALIDCEADNLRSGVSELLPLATQAVLAAISGDGRHVDTEPLKTAARAMRSDLGRCALASALAMITAPPMPLAGAAKAAPLSIDPEERARVLAALRPELGGAVYLTRAGVL